MKKAHSWSGLFTAWGQRAAALTGRAPRDLIADAIDGHYTRPLRSRDIGPGSHRDLAALAGVGVQERRATWNAWNLEAEIARLTKPLTMASAADRGRLHAAVLKQAVAQCVPLHEQQVLTDRWAGMRLRWTSTAILDAENHLLQVAHVGSGPAVEPRLAELIAEGAMTPGIMSGGRVLAADQAAAITSARLLNGSMTVEQDLKTRRGVTRTSRVALAWRELACDRESDRPDVRRCWSGHGLGH